MREFTRFQYEHTSPVSRHSWPVFGFLGHLLKNMNARHVLHEIADHDDHMLNDMGITRADVEVARHTFITSDAVATLENARKSHNGDVEVPVTDKNGLESTNFRHLT